MNVSKSSTEEEMERERRLEKIRVYLEDMDDEEEVEVEVAKFLLAEVDRTRLDTLSGVARRVGEAFVVAENMNRALANLTKEFSDVILSHRERSLLRFSGDLGPALYALGLGSRNANLLDLARGLVDSALEGYENDESELPTRAREWLEAVGRNGPPRGKAANEGIALSMAGSVEFMEEAVRLGRIEEEELEGFKRTMAEEVEKAKAIMRLKEASDEFERRVVSEDGGEVPAEVKELMGRVGAMLKRFEDEGFAPTEAMARVIDEVGGRLVEGGDLLDRIRAEVERRGGDPKATFALEFDRDDEEDE